MEMGGAAYGVRSNRKQGVERQTPYGAGFVAEHVRNAQGGILQGEVAVDIENYTGREWRSRAVRDSRPMGSPRTSRANVLNPTVQGRPGSGDFANGIIETGQIAPAITGEGVDTGYDRHPSETTGEQSEPLKPNTSVNRGR